MYHPLSRVLYVKAVGIVQLAELPAWYLKIPVFYLERPPINQS